MQSLNPLSAQDTFARLKSGQIVLVDVREPDEYAREHIAGAVLAPLSAFETSNLKLEPGKSVVFMCRSGNRTGQACERLAARIDGQALVLEGGLNAWKQAGLPVAVDTKQPLELMRQVQIAAGSLILLGALLGTLVHPGLWGISAFVGAGLLVAGTTGFCGMANLLLVMPWNRHLKRT